MSTKEPASPMVDDYAARHLEHIRTYDGRKADPNALDTLAFARCALLEHGASLLITRHGRNRDGDRHRMTVQLVYLRQTGELSIIGLTWCITNTGWMDKARGSEGHIAIFGGGGLSPVAGTAWNLAYLLGIEDYRAVNYWEGQS